jgi:hypothetical protein
VEPIVAAIAAHCEAAKAAWRVDRYNKKAEETLRTWERLQRFIASGKPALVAEAKKQAAALLGGEKPVAESVPVVAKSKPVKAAVPPAAPAVAPGTTSYMGAPVVSGPAVVMETPAVSPKKAVPKKRATPKKRTPKPKK